MNFTKSINLALSERGINSMRHAGVEGLVDEVLKETIPMHARMIHGRSKLGDLYEESQAYDVHGRVRNPQPTQTPSPDPLTPSQTIFAVDRAGLNKRLLDSLESMPNVTFFFSHKLTGADYSKSTAWFEHRSPPKTDHAQNPTQQPSNPFHERAPEIEVKFDVLIGADGAHSAARYHMMKYARVNYQQEYIDTLWCEFHIAPSPHNSDFAISPHHLHIWPGSAFMFIAIPSLDRSFTCTLFAPSATFTSLAASPETSVPAFFAGRFPGVSPNLISTADLVSQFTGNPHLPLINIQCTPYHYSSSGVILGDAAHAMVPFYGQGMNAGLEDVRVLFDFLDAHGVYASCAPPSPPSPRSPSSSFITVTSPSPSPSRAATRAHARSQALAAYTAHRRPDTHAINALALRNYLEMRSSVTSPFYLLRKRIEETLYKHFPSLGWATQYSRVSFGNERYSEVERLARRQGSLLRAWGIGGMVGLAVGVGWLGRRMGWWRGLLGGRGPGGDGWGWWLGGWKGWY